jgi:hypothetical protein
MAYANKYKITVATKSDIISYVYLLEDGYIGDLIEYPATSVSLQYIPQSDDVFESIMVSQLSVSIDITDDEINMPNFTTLDDRKYLVQVYNESIMEWQGWSLSDNVNISYTTGRKELSFNAIDGLGILEKIKFPITTSSYLTELQTCISFIVNSLNQIQFPTPLNIISGISYYSDSMLNRDDASYYEPLIQSYLRLVTFLDDNTVVTDCLTIIKEICKGFGAKIFQANCKWYIITPNQFAQESYYFTEYNPIVGSIVDSGLISYKGNIQPYTGNTSGLYFVDNSQTKILRKGYNKVKLSKNIDYPTNLITNANLAIYTDNDAFSWSNTTSGTGLVIVKVYENTGFNSFVLQGGAVASSASVEPNFIPTLNFNDIITLSLDFSNILAFSDKANMLKIYIRLSDGTTSVYLNSDRQWVTTATTYNVLYEGGVFPTTPPSVIKSVSIDFPPAPLSGTLIVNFISDEDCITWVEISNFKLDSTQLFKSVTTESYISNSEEYVYNVDLNVGINYSISGKFYYRGALCDLNGDSLQGWYRYEYPTDIYNSLSELVIKQYSNILENNIINIDSTIFGLINNSGNLNASMRITSDDIDVINSVEGKKYILGNSTLNIINSEAQSTLLEVNDVNIETTLVTTYEDTNPQRVWGRKRSVGGNTAIEAAGQPLTSSIIYQNGAFFYTDRNLTHKFTHAGTASKYYKVQNQDTTSTNIFNISPAGKIVAFEPR